MSIPKAIRRAGPAASRALVVAAAVVVVAMLWSAAPGRTQEGSAPPAGGGATGTADTARAAAPQAPGPASPGPQTPYIMPPIGQAILADPHNKLIHFPIVLNLIAAVMVIVARRKPQYEPVAFWLVWFGVLATLAAYFSGLVQSEEFMRRPKRWLVDTHMRWGIALAMAQCVWVLTLIRRRTRGFATVWSLVVVALVLVTGFLGGLVAHSRGAAPPPAARAATR